MYIRAAARTATSAPISLTYQSQISESGGDTHAWQFSEIFSSRGESNTAARASNLPKNSKLAPIRFIFFAQS